MKEIKYITYNDKLYKPGILADGTKIFVPLEHSTVVLSKAELLTGPDKVKVKYITLDKVNELIKTGLASSHKHIIGTIDVPNVAAIHHFINEFNAGHDIQLKDGTVYNRTVALSGDIIYFTDPSHKIATEEVIVDSSKHMMPLSTGNILLTKVQGILDHDTTDGKTIGTTIEKLVVESDITRLNTLIDKNKTDLDAEKIKIGQNHAAISSGIHQMNSLETNFNKEVKAFNDLKTEVNTNKLGVDDYFNSKASFITENDVLLHVKNLGDRSKPTKTGNDYEWILNPMMVKGFKSPNVVQIKVQDATTSRYFKDSFNDGHSTTVTVGHKSYSTTLTDTELTVHTNEDLSNCELVYFETETATKALTRDDVARNAANAAQTTANAAKTKADTNETLINTNTTNINNKQDKVLSNAYPGSVKGVEAAMTNIYNTATTNTNNINTLNDIDVKTTTGVINLDQMDTVGAGTNEDKLLVTVKEVQAMINAALNTAMHITFDDNSKDDFKIGK